MMITKEIKILIIKISDTVYYCKGDNAFRLERVKESDVKMCIRDRSEFEGLDSYFKSEYNKVSNE